MATLATYFWVMLGGALGTAARYGLGVWALRLWGESFPWGTLIINVTGSFLISFFAGLTGPDGRWHAPLNARLFFMVGICGGFTTFSSFSLQTLRLAAAGAGLPAAANVLGSVALCLAGVWLGSAAATALNPPEAGGE